MTSKEQKAYDEALKRIETCYHQGAEILDLAGLVLTWLPPESANSRR